MFLDYGLQWCLGARRSKGIHLREWVGDLQKRHRVLHHLLLERNRPIILNLNHLLVALHHEKERCQAGRPARVLPRSIDLVAADSVGCWIVCRAIRPVCVHVLMSSIYVILQDEMCFREDWNGPHPTRSRWYPIRLNNRLPIQLQSAFLAFELHSPLDGVEHPRSDPTFLFDSRVRAIDEDESSLSSSQSCAINIVGRNRLEAAVPHSFSPFGTVGLDITGLVGDDDVARFVDDSFPPFLFRRPCPQRGAQSNSSLIGSRVVHGITKAASEAAVPFTVMTWKSSGTSLQSQANRTHLRISRSLTRVPRSKCRIFDCRITEVLLPIHRRGPVVQLGGDQPKRGELAAKPSSTPSS